MRIVILEDNRERQEAMRQCLADRFHTYPVECFDSVAGLMAHLDQHLGEAVCIALDHDLELVPDGNGGLIDPGTGREAADYLCRRAPQCPVVIHSTNTAAADGMEFCLRDAGWKVTRVIPWGDLDWIPTQWFRAVRRAIVNSARPAGRNGTAPGSTRTSGQSSSS